MQMYRKGGLSTPRNSENPKKKSCDKTTDWTTRATFVRSRQKLKKIKHLVQITCSNYRKTALIFHASKVLLIIISIRIKNYGSSETALEQAAEAPGASSSSCV